MRKVILVCFLLFCSISSAYGKGLKAPGQISFSDAVIGQSYSFKGLSGSHYEVANYIQDNLKIALEPAIPAEGELISVDFEAIPDISWVKFEEETFILKYGESTPADFNIGIPDEPKYMGKKFQFNIRIKLTDFPQVRVPPTKITIAVSEDRIPLLQLIRQFEADRLEFDLTPHEYLISNFPLGERIDLSDFTGKTFEISNRNEQKYAFRITASADTAPDRTVSFEDFLSFDAGEVILKPNSNKIFHPYLLIPDEEIYRSREFMFTINAQVIGQIPEQNRSSVITVRTKGDIHE